MAYHLYGTVRNPEGLHELLGLFPELREDKDVGIYIKEYLEQEDRELPEDVG